MGHQSVDACENMKSIGAGTFDEKNHVEMNRDQKQQAINSASHGQNAPTFIIFGPD